LHSTFLIAASAILSVSHDEKRDVQPVAWAFMFNDPQKGADFNRVLLIFCEWTSSCLTHRGWHVYLRLWTNLVMCLRSGSAIRLHTLDIQACRPRSI